MTDLQASNAKPPMEAGHWALPVGELGIYEPLEFFDIYG